MSNLCAHPRPEYPRPDRQRGTLEGTDWLNLNGPWQFRFDRHRRGIDENWFAPEQPEWREQIIVPFCWESLAAWGEGDAAGNDNYYANRVFINPLEVDRSNHRSAARYEVGWYRCVVELPNNAAWHGKRAILTIGAADFFTDCWCNGKHLGHHEGGYTPFEFDLTDALETGPDGVHRAQIVLRVEDPMDNHEQPVGKQWRWYTTTSGIWQTVFIEPRNPTHIRSFRIFTDIDAGTARFEVRCAEVDDDYTVAAEILPPGAAAPLSPRAFAVKKGIADETIKVSPLLLWNPNEAHLYKVVLRLQRAGQTVDTVRTYFGMRKIDFAPGGSADSPTLLRLNGEPRYLRGALHQSYYPDGVYTAGDVATLKNDIACAKKAGFNFLRIHIKIDDPLLLYYADKMGMLLMTDIPNFGEGGDTPLGRRRFEAMMREALERDFNHPSIFAWCIFNETWGFGGQVEFADLIRSLDPKNRLRSQKRIMQPAAAPARETAVATATETMEAPQPARTKLANLGSHAWVQSMWQLAKKLDPTRLIEDMSVVHWEHLDYYAHGDTDINSWHFYIDDYEKAKEHIAKVVKSTFPGSNFNYVPGFAHKGQPLINSEYGGVGALDGDRDVSWTFKFLTNELRRHGQISGYIYTELHDVEWEHNGFLNYDRTPKDFGYDPAIINESDTLPMNAPPIARVPPGRIVRVEVASSHFSSRLSRDISLCWRMDGMDTRGQLRQTLARGHVPIVFPHRRVVPAHTIELPMPAEPMLCTLSIWAATAGGAVVAQNFVQYQISEQYPPLREEIPRALILRGTPGDWAAAEWSGGMCDRDRAGVEDCCFGHGRGYFEWVFPLGGADVSKAHRIRVICEASSHRIDTPQTDADIFPTTLQMFLNGIQVYHALIRNHPHDARGALSYLRGGLGAYGYLAHAFAEAESVRQIARHAMDDSIRLRCVVPDDALAQGGLTIYGAECGRYPVAPTLIIEW